MTRRRKLTPPPDNTVAYAAAYRCHDCTGQAESLWQDHTGLWHITIAHDQECPVLTGDVSPAAADVAAAQAAGIPNTAVIVAVRRAR